jgi:hypothetical protein
MFKDISSNLKKEFSTDGSICPKDTTGDKLKNLKSTAYFDQIKEPADERFGYMHCYCIAEAKLDPVKFTQISFT